jgi:hypothetical protein
LKELDRNVGETEVDQTDADQMDANPGTKRHGVFPAVFLGLDERATPPENEINERERL